jgi:diguanylate cyclase (GGDEF)-like protein
VHALAHQLSAGLTQLARLERVRRLAFTDALTGLANRRAADIALQDAVERHQSDGTVVSLIVCDLNGLKRVNDTDGHEAGDRLLKEFATRLKSAARTLPGCVAARVGGDEFCVIAGGRRASDVMAVAERICHDTWRLGRGDGVACGVASAPGTRYPGTTAEALFHQADTAQYHAKQARARRPVLATSPSADGDATAASTARTRSRTPAPVPA